MNASHVPSPVWARHVAHAMEKKLNASDSPFHWAKSTDEGYKKPPTVSWPSDPWYVYQVGEGSNEGLIVEVFHRTAQDNQEKLLTVKFLTSIKAAGACLTAVTEFLENFNPAQLQAA